MRPGTLLHQLKRQSSRPASDLDAQGDFPGTIVDQLRPYPVLVGLMPVFPAIVICCLVALAVGALWSLIPALLKARQGDLVMVSTPTRLSVVTL